MDKQFLYASVDQKASVLTHLSDTIWDYAELSMAEVKSAEYYCRLLELEGFQVERNVCGLPTAFSGSFGSGSPRIGILGEFDALSGLSQQAGAAEHIPLAEDGCGHGCGHNLLGAASLGAAMAIKAAIEEGNLTGTVIFYGCPGEEGCAGKTFMARDGMFRDLDAAITWHPGDTNEITVGSCAASIQVEYSFSGIAAHAAGNPDMGRSALDAAELMNVGVQFLREHMPAGSSIHYSFADAGGISPNVVQPKSKLIYMIRGMTVTKAKALWERVNNIARGAALMTDTTVSWHQIDGTASMLSNTVLEQALYDNLQAAPMPEYTEDERVFAKQLHATYPSGIPGNQADVNPTLCAFAAKETDNGARALNDFVMPYMPNSIFRQGSTDVGDVSWLTPTAQFNTATWTSCAPGHSWQNVSIGRTSIAHKGMLYAAKILAGTAADLMTDPALLQRARAEFDLAAAEGYDCPIDDKVTITIG